MDGEKKNSFKVLTASDIRKHAQHWSLAGDVGLLAHLEQFSQNVCNKTQETEKYFNELIDNYEKVYTNIGNITNQFLALQNCQFVENRVYDEETPTEEKAPGKEIPGEAEQERLLLTKYKEAVEVGVKLLDTHFQEVQLPPNSDSDEEDEEVSTGNSFIWKPKNPYATKKFPLLIGSNEWWADDTVGLGNLEESLDSERLISESESEADSLEGVEKRMQSSSSSLENVKFIPTKPTFLDSSSEDLFGLSSNDNNQNDLFGKGSDSRLSEPENLSPSLEKQDEIKTNGTENSLSGSQVSERTANACQHESLSKTFPKANHAFTKELEAKLSSVVSNKNEDDNWGNAEKTKKSEKVEKVEQKKSYSRENLFDEPDDANDLFSENGKIKSVGSSKNMFFDAEGDDQLFSGSNNLFFEAGSIFDSDAPKKSEPGSGAKIRGKGKGDDTFQKTHVLPNNKSLVDDLFGNMNDDDILFASKPAEKKQGNEGLPYIENNSFNKEILLVPENFPENDGEGLFDSINNDFGNDLLAESPFLDSKVIKRMDFRIAVNSKNAVTKAQSGEANDNGTERRGIPDGSTSIFESNDKTKHSVDVSNLFSSSDKKISFLEGEDRDRDDLFSSTFKQDSLFKERKKACSLSKLIPGPEDDDPSLFASKPKQQDSASISSSRSSLFEEVGASKSRLASVFEKDKSSKVEDYLFNDDTIFGGESSSGKAEEDLFSNKPRGKVKEEGKNSLFYDFDDSDDLFGPANEQGEAVEDKSLFEKSKEKLGAVKNAFDATSQKNSDSVYDVEAPKKAAMLSKINFDYDLGDVDLFRSDVEKGKVEEDEHAEAKEERKTLENHNVADETKLRESKSDIFGNASIAHSERKFFADLVSTNPSKKSEKTSYEAAKPTPPTSLNFKKHANSEKSSTTKSVGKLNIPDNLKVKFESMAKNISSGEAKLEEKTAKEFDNPIEPSSNLLKCPSKDRVKIPGRRRPQSRRARQEAIRNSGADFGLVSEDEKSVAEYFAAKPNKSNSCVNISQSGLMKISSEPSFPSPSASNPMSPSTDEEDYFNVPELDTRFEEDQGIFRSNLFQSSNDSKLEDNLLFDGAPILSPLSPKKGASQCEEKVVGGVDSLFAFSQANLKLKPKGSIFDDEEEDGGGNEDSLFKNEVSSRTRKGKPGEDKSTAGLVESGAGQNFGGNVRAKKPLFDEDDMDDDEEDLFGGNSKCSALFCDDPVEKTSKIMGKNVELKDKENQSFVDPLGLMSKD